MLYLVTFLLLTTNTALSFGCSFFETEKWIASEFGTKDKFSRVNFRGKA